VVDIILSKLLQTGENVMSIDLKEVTYDNYEEVMQLKIPKEQVKFILTDEEIENQFNPITSQMLYGIYCPGSHPLAIYKDDVIVGFMIYNFQSGEKCGWLSSLIIDGKFQNLGIGKVAIQKFIEMFYEKHELVPLVTNTDKDNFLALKLYEGLGFRKCENMDDYDMDVDNVFLVRNL